MTEADTSLVEQADRAAAVGDVRAARALLERLETPDFETWMKLAAMRRMTGDLPRSLEAVHGALALAPLDFVALLSRAMLLEKLGDPEADAMQTRPQRAGYEVTA